MSRSTNICSDGNSVSEEERTSPQVSAPTLSLSGFLRALFRLLDENEVRYCVLHSWDSLPDSLPSDLDIAVDPQHKGRLAQVIRELANAGYTPIQRRRHAGGVRFDFAWFDAQGLQTVGVDVADQYREKGLILISGSELISGRRRFNGFWVSGAAIEFVYLLAKKSLKQQVPQHQAERLAALVHEIGTDRAKQVAANLFGEGWRDRVVQACLDGSLASLLPVLKKRLWLTQIGHDPLNPVRFCLGNIPRLVVRVLRPVGLFAVILGPDGAGKSTLVGRIAELLGQAAFNRFRIFHWRPNVVFSQPDTGVPSSDPHDESPRGFLGSTAALLAILLDYILGYIFILRPFLTRAGLVIFDRYYDDLLVDPLRYRYGGPMWLARFVRHFIPPPDLLFLVLDADEAVILARKQEVPQEELRRQRESYRLFTQDSQRATLIRTDAGIEQTANEASRFIVEYLVKNFQRRHGIQGRGSKTTD